MAEEGIGSMTDGARDELRELLFDGIAPPLDTEAMFARTFSASGDDGAHLLPPDDLFDADPADGLPLDDAAFDDAALDGLDDPALDPTLDDAALLDGDADPDDLADPAVDWADPAPADPAAGDAPDAPFDPHSSGW